MPTYPIALPLHLLALTAASIASGAVHLASARRGRSATAREALDWHAIASRASIAFPVCTLTLILTGAWMVGNSSVTWQTSWVAASAVGATFLMVAGAALGARGARLRAQLEAQVSAHPDRRPVAPTDPVMALLGDANTGVALALVIVMTIKAGLGVSLAIIVAGGAAGALAALRGMRDTRLEHAGESQATQMGAYTGT